jgi:hypothetical protein
MAGGHTAGEAVIVRSFCVGSARILMQPVEVNAEAGGGRASWGRWASPPRRFPSVGGDKGNGVPPSGGLWAGAASLQVRQYDMR